MREPNGNGVAAYILTLVLGIVGALALANAAACEQWDRACLVSLAGK